MQFLVSLALIWSAVYIAVIAARITRMTPVIWFLVIGCLMVNTGFLPEKTNPFIEGMASLGIILIMFALGFEEKTDNFLVSIKKSWGIAFFGALAPFITAYSVADYFWNDTNISLMCGLTMTATAVSLTMVSLKSEGLQLSKAATRIMTSAVLDDIASLALVAILVPIASGAAPANIVSVGLIAGKAILFFLIVFLLGAWVFPLYPGGKVGRIPFISRYGLRNLLAFDKARHATLTLLLLALVVGLMAHELGFHPAIGAYMAGLVLKEEYFRLDYHKTAWFKTKDIIDSAAFSWIGPVFFIVLGSKLVFDLDIFLSIIPQTLILLTGLFIAQVSSAAIAARYTGGMDWPGGIMVGFGMLGRAELAFVVIDIAYVQNSILNTQAFYTLMLTAFLLNIAVPITIKLWKPHYVK